MKSLGNSFMQFWRDKQPFLKVQIIIIVVVISLVTITGVAYTTNAQKVLVKRFSDSCQNTLEEVKKSMDLITENIVDISKQVYDDPYLYTVMEKTNITNYYDIDMVMRRVLQVKYSNRYIHSVYLYMDKSQLMFSSIDRMYDIERFNDKFFMSWYKNDPQNYVLADTHPIKSNIPTLNDVDHAFSMFVRLPLLGLRSQTNGALIINFKQSLIYNGIIEKLNDRVPIFVINNKNKIILAKEDKHLYKDIKSFDFYSKEMEGIQGNYTIAVEGEQYLVVYNTADKWNWKYISVYPVRDIYQTIGNIRNLVVFISILMIILSAVVSGYFTLREFRPIEEILGAVRKRIQLNGKYHEQMTEIKNTISNVFVNNEELRKKLDMALPVFKERFLYSLIMETHKDRQDVIDKLKAFSVGIDDQDLILSILTIEDYEEAIYDNTYDENIIRFIIDNLMGEFFSQERLQAFWVETRTGEITVVIAANNARPNSFVNVFRRLQDLIQRKIGITITIGVYDSPIDITNLKSSYQKAQEALKHKILYDKKSLIFYSEVKENRICEYDYPYDKVEYLKNYIRICDKANAIIKLHEIIKDIVRVKSYFYIQHLIIQLNSTFIDMANEVNLSLSDIYKNENILEKILKLESIEGIENFFSTIIEKIINAVDSNRESKMAKHYSRIINYLESNYMNDVTLESMSEDIILSPNYINYILKTMTDKTFVYHLNKIRIDKACEYLKDGGMKVKDIAYKVGFTSSKYFIKIFKEMKGVTPGKFRNTN